MNWTVVLPVNRITIALVALILGSSVFGQSTNDAERLPNFVLINVDDLGYADIGPFGSDNHTPHLDQMAAEGRRLTSHYAAPVCSPSRASLMTGCYPKRVLPIPHVLFPAGEVGLNPDEITIAELLKTAGYATACFGKWHLGDQPSFLPTNQGFDTYFGIPYSNDMGPPQDGSKSNLGKPLPEPTPQRLANDRTKRDELGIRGMAQPPLPLLEDDKVVDRVGAKGQAEVTRQYTERATKFIREHRDNPFFVYLPHSAVHFPLYPSEEFIGTSPNGLIGDWAQEVDWSVGEVLSTIREFDLQENTLVIFTSDNGGALRHGSKNQPLRGTKGQTWEGGIRVCTMAWWPGKIPAGTSTDAITTTMDILPTFARLAGVQPPQDRKIDGVDVTSVLLGDPENEPRQKFFYFRGLNLQAVRSGPWKLHLSVSDKKRGSRHDPPRPQLFHLGNDIGEMNDLSKSNPDMVAKLQELAQSLRKDIGTEGIGRGCRRLGRIRDPKPLMDADGTVRDGAVANSKFFPPNESR